MEDISRSTSDQDKISLEDLYWFYAKSKVPICLAITECFPYLETFVRAGILSEEENLMLQADTRSIHRVIYESLCYIEEKNLPLEYFFDNLFQEHFVNLYPNLKSIHNEYMQGNYKSGLHTSTDKEKDQMIFAQEKVKICLAVTDLFPFIHGLQDLTILSEIESLKLQADGRPTSQVIYDCLSLIEKKDLKLSFVFEYIFQQCYQTLYPGLQVILQESNMEQVGPFHGKPVPVFKSPGALLEFYENNKCNISAAINECFPFLHGLHDMGLLSKLELLRLQADKRTAKEVVYEALSWIQPRHDMEAVFAYVFRDVYLRRFPALKAVLLRLNQALILDKSLPIPAMKGAMIEQTRKCKLKPICYTELSDCDWELMGDNRKNAGVQTSGQLKTEKEQNKKIKQERKEHERNSELHIPKDGKYKERWIQHAASVAVRVEFPKQLFNYEFLVKCGNKKGLFLREQWTGDPRNDECIKCDKKMFTVTKFEKYGGREAAKNWKKSLRCSGLSLEKLFQFNILKSPRCIRGKLKSSKKGGGEKLSFY